LIFNKWMKAEQLARYIKISEENAVPMTEEEIQFLFVRFQGLIRTTIIKYVNNDN